MVAKIFLLTRRLNHVGGLHAHLFRKLFYGDAFRNGDLFVGRLNGLLLTPRIRRAKLTFFNLGAGAGAAGWLGLMTALLLSRRRSGGFRPQWRGRMLRTSTAGKRSGTSWRSTAHAGRAGNSRTAHRWLAGTNGAAINWLSWRWAGRACRKAWTLRRRRGLAGSAARGWLL